MNIWIKSIAAAGILAIAAFFLLKKLNEKKLLKKYNLEYTIEAEPEKGSAMPFSLSKIADILEQRLQTTDYEFKIETNGKSRIHVSLFEILDTLFPTSIFTSNGRVQFRELYNMIEVKEMLMTAFGIMENKDPAPEKEDSVSKKTGDLAENLEPAVEPEKNPLLSLIEFSQPYPSESGNITYPSAIGMVKLKDTAATCELFRSEKVRLLTPADLQIRFGEANKKLRKGEKQGDQLISLYFLKTRGSPDKAILENEDISEATQGFDQYGKVEIRMQFNEYGARKWKTMTWQNIGRSIAIIIDGTVISAPTVISEIPDGTSSITGSYSVDEAQQLCAGLKSSKLPAVLRIISSDVKLAGSNSEKTKMLLITLIIFILSAGLAFFVFKTLKVT